MNAQTNEDATATGHEIWLLRLVPPGPWGRCIAAIVLLAGTIALYQQVGAFAGFFAGGDAWAAAPFFCVILAYITLVFHLVTERTEAAFDALVHRLGMEVSEAKRLRGLEAENVKLTRLLAEAELDMAALKDMIGKKW